MLRIRLFIILLVTSIILAELFHFLVTPFVKNSLLQFLLLGCIFGTFFFGIANNYIKKLRKFRTVHSAVREELYLDKLTSLLNRRAFERDIRTMTTGMDMSCIFIDIDDFRNFNNIYGHNAGDVVLKKVATTILDCVRKSDNVYRYGGEEMVIILSDVTKVDAVNLAEKIRRQINFLSNYPYPKISISLGVASYPNDGYKLPEIIAAADKALLRAKKQGKNRTEAINLV